MTVAILHGDCRAVLRTLPERSVHACVTSPPYWRLRRYLPETHPLAPLEIGQEGTPEAYIAVLVDVFREVRRVLRDEGTLWVNLGDAYAASGRGGGGRLMAERKAWRDKACTKGSWAPPEGLKPKDLIGLPWMLAFALRADSWYLRSEVVWSKLNPTPESARDRPTRAHEHVFLLSKRETYFYDTDAVREPHADPRWAKGGRTMLRGQAALRPRGKAESAERWYNPAGRNCRSVWPFPTEPFGGGHFAVMPSALARRCVLASTSERGACPTCGAPWTRQVRARRLVDGEERPIRAACTTDKAAPSRAQGVGHGRITITRDTEGWRASCACDVVAPPVPCTVLDPFGGSGTVGKIATELGRHATLIDLHPDYIAIANKRTAQEGLFAREAR